MHVHDNMWPAGASFVRLFELLFFFIVSLFFIFFLFLDTPHNSN